MKSVLASFKPRYCELIASGKKTVELRKTRPKLDVPFKVYMYQTKGHWIYKILEWLKLYQGKVIGEFVCDDIDTYEIEYPSRFENVFRAIYRHIKDEDGEEYSFVEASNDMTDAELSNSRLLSQSQLTLDEIGEYVCGKKHNFNDFYTWHISDLVIYDKPKDLSEFYRECNGIHCRGNDCEHWKYMRVNADEFEMDCDCNELPPITRPPQSWCYVEEVQGNEQS